MSIKGKRVFVGLSGGVDSAVSAALLKKAGAFVTGVFIKGWYPPSMPCTWAADRRDAMRVAARLGIPFLTLDAQAAYKQGVIDYLLAEYKAGRTPNPDIMCNREIKFGVFHAFAKERGADFIATGHYARAEADSTLFRGSDAAKDQSYFLWAVPKATLAQVLFPLGAMKKESVRNTARRMRLPVAEKKDSQGICFLGSVSVRDFLRQELGILPGSAVDEEGNTVGEHDGASLATIGERVALTHAPPGPWFVLAKNHAKNTLTVGKKGEPLTRALGQPLVCTESNWFQDAHRATEAQTRYHGPLYTGTVSGDGTFTPSCALAEPSASGQSIVFYKGDEVIGGGILA